MFRLPDSRERDAHGLQSPRIDHDAVLLDEAANARNLGHAFRIGDAIAHVPVLDGAQFGEAFLCAANDILKHPADAGRIRPEAAGHAARRRARSRTYA